jgi:hypothetical protein
MARRKSTPRGLFGSEAKTKNLTLRITPALANRIDKVRSICKANGIAWSVTTALTTALTDEINAMDKYLSEQLKKEFNSLQDELDLGVEDNTRT